MKKKNEVTILKEAMKGDDSRRIVQKNWPIGATAWLVARVTSDGPN